MLKGAVTAPPPSQKKPHIRCIEEPAAEE